jgi:hypothetical protein
VLQTLDKLRTINQNTTVQARHKGDPIKTTYLNVLTTHIDVKKLETNASQISEVRHESQADRRKVFDQDGNKTLFDILGLQQPFWVCNALHQQIELRLYAIISLK